MGGLGGRSVLKKEVNASFTEEVTFEQRVDRIHGGAFQVQNTASMRVSQWERARRVGGRKMA